MKIREILAGASALSMLAAPMPLAAQDGAPRAFTMDGSWTLDAGDDYCRLAANFTNEGDTISFGLERNRADNLARMILVTDAITTYRGAQALGYTYEPGGEERMAMFLRSETPGGQDYFNLGAVFIGPDPFGAGPGASEPGGDAAAPAAPGADTAPGTFVQPPYDRAAELAYAANISSILVDEGLRTPVRIQTGSLRAPIQALQACTDDLLRVWGLDYEKHQTMTRRAAPSGPAHEWLATGTIGFQDFPLLSGGRNPVRVMVDAEGRPTSCHVHWPSLTERKNASICEQIMDNGEFEPALDAEGNAMASYWMVDPAFGLTRPFGRR